MSMFLRATPRLDTLVFPSEEDSTVSSIHTPKHKKYRSFRQLLLDNPVTQKKPDVQGSTFRSTLFIKQKISLPNLKLDCLDTRLVPNQDYFAQRPFTKNCKGSPEFSTLFSPTENNSMVTKYAFHTPKASRSKINIYQTPKIAQVTPSIPIQTVLTDSDHLDSKNIDRIDFGNVTSRSKRTFSIPKLIIPSTEKKSINISLKLKQKKKFIPPMITSGTPQEKHIKKILEKVDHNMSTTRSVCEDLLKKVQENEDENNEHHRGRLLPMPLNIGTMNFETMTKKLKEFRDITIKKSKNIAGKEDYKTKKFFKRHKKNKGTLFQKFTQNLLKVCMKIENLGLNIDEIARHKAFPKYAYERPGSRDFMKLVKHNNFDEVQSMLRNCKYYVYTFDELSMTPLHWAVKRMYLKIAKLLLENGADPDAKDISGRTPLFLAAHAQKLIAVRLLISYGADPTIRSEGHYVAGDYAEDHVIKTYIQRSYKVHVILGACSIKKRKEVWNNLRPEFEITYTELP